MLHKPPWLSISWSQSMDSPQGTVKRALACRFACLERGHKRGQESQVAAEQLCHWNPFPSRSAHLHRPELRGGQSVPVARQQQACLQKATGLPSLSSIPRTGHPAQRPPVSPSSFPPLLFKAPKSQASHRRL